MNDYTIRTRLKERPVNFQIRSLQAQPIANFMRSHHIHRTPTGLAYLQQIINHFTNKAYIDKASDLARLGTFILLENREALYRPGDQANDYFLVIAGQLGELEESEFRVYSVGEGVGDEEMYLRKQRRTSYVFQSSNSMTIICRIPFEIYTEIFNERVENVVKYLEKSNQFELLKTLDIKKRVMLLKDAKQVNVLKIQRLYEIGDQVKGIYIVVEGAFRETMDRKQKRHGDNFPAELNQIEDFRQYVLSYDVLRNNQQVVVKSRLSHRQNDAIGLMQLYYNQLQRASTVRALKDSKVLFFSITSLRRHAFTQIVHNKPVYQTRRKSRIRSLRSKTIASSSAITPHSQVAGMDFKCRKLVYARHLN